MAEIKKDCLRCGGTGSEPDNKAIGSALKKMRRASNIGLREMARRIRISYGFLCQLESGDRTWTPRIIKRYEEQL